MGGGHGEFSHRMVREDISLRVTCEQKVKDEAGGHLGKEHFGRRSSRCRGLDWGHLALP